MDKRLEGDVHYFLTGDKSKLTADSIYTRIYERDGVVTTVYSDLIDHVGMDEDYYDFEAWANYHGSPMKPCISRVDIDPVEQILHVKFSRVDSEQFPYDIACVKALIKDDSSYTITFEGRIKEFNSNKENKK